MYDKLTSQHTLQNTECQQRIRDEFWKVPERLSLSLTILLSMVYQSNTETLSPS